MTLAELAGTELSIGLVSRIERGLVNPSLATLTYLAQRLGVGLADLFADDRPDGSTPLGALFAARALLLLGDPAAAAEVAGTASEGPGVGPAIRARLLALAAEASLAAGNPATAARRLAEGSAVVPAPSGAGRCGQAGHAVVNACLARAELAWVLGALERRRGNRAAAERSWGHCLDLLENGRALPLGAALLRARALAELGDLHESAGAMETARNFLMRAASALAELTEPGVVARRLLIAGGVPWGRVWDESRAGGAAAIDGAGAVLGRSAVEAVRLGAPAEAQPCPPAPVAAAALAMVAAAVGLAERVGHALDRLERLAATWPAAASPPEVPHSRHLR